MASIRRSRFPPFQLDFVHDASAFQLVIGSAMVLGLLWRHALLAVLAGGSMATVTYAISHIIDRHLGGGGDPWSLSGLAVLLLVAALRARPHHQRESR